PPRRRPAASRRPERRDLSKPLGLAPWGLFVRLLERRGVLAAHPLEREQLDRPPPRRAAERAAARRIGEQLGERQGVLLRIVGGEDAGVAQHFAERGSGYGHHRTATRHRLGEREPER